MCVCVFSHTVTYAVREVHTTFCQMRAHAHCSRDCRVTSASASARGGPSGGRTHMLQRTPTPVLVTISTREGQGWRVCNAAR